MPHVLDRLEASYHDYGNHFAVLFSEPKPALLAKGAAVRKLFASPKFRIQKVRVLEHFGDACSIFSARFRYIEFHFRPASQSIKIFATRLDVVRASSRAALSRAAFTSLGILAVRTTAGGGGLFFVRGGIAIPFAIVYVC